MTRASRANKEVRVSGKARVFKEKFEEERQSKVVKLVPKTEAQAAFIECMKNNQVAIGMGSAGAGKSFLAGSFICNEYLTNPDIKILLARPYVPMGGRTVGFLKGTAEEKLEAFVAAQTSILKEQLGSKFVSDFGKTINVQLLEAIRGLDLKNTILWVDECQLLSRDEFKCILTRISEGGKVIFTGDPLQSDLRDAESGLEWVIDMIVKYDIKGCDFVEFTDEDCVRSGVVKAWLKVFDKEGI